MGVHNGSLLGGAFKACEKIFVNKILLIPMRENVKCPKALPSLGFRVYTVQNWTITYYTTYDLLL